MGWVAVGLTVAGTVYAANKSSQAAGKATSAQTKGAKNATQAELDMYYQGRADMAPWRAAGEWALGIQKDTSQEPLLGYDAWKAKNGIQTQAQPTPRNLTQDEWDRGVQRQQSFVDPNLAAYNAYVDDWNRNKREFKPSGTFREGSLLDKINKGPGDYTKSPGYEFRLGEGVKARERGASARGNVLSGEEAKALTKFGQDYGTQDYDNFLSQFYQSLTPLQSLAGVGQTTAGQTAQMGMQTGQSVGQNYLAAGDARASGYINQANVATGAINSGVSNYLTYDYLKNKNN